MSWIKFEKDTAQVLGTKPTKSSGRYTHKGDSQSDTLIVEAKAHTYQSGGRVYTIIKGRWFKDLVQHAIKEGKIPILVAKCGAAHLYFVLEAPKLMWWISKPIPQGKEQVTIYSDEIDSIYGDTVEFANERWMILPRADVKALKEVP